MEKDEQTVKTNVKKNLRKTPIGDIRDVVPNTDSCLIEPEKTTLTQRIKIR